MDENCNATVADARNTDISKNMWSEVKSRNKFLTINKNNEVHLFDLNSYCVYVIFLFSCFRCTNSSHYCILLSQYLYAGLNHAKFATMHQPLSNTMEQFSGNWRNLRLMIQIIKTYSQTYVPSICVKFTLQSDERVFICIVTHIWIAQANFFRFFLSDLTASSQGKTVFVQ